MEWNIGVEMRNEYRRMELARAAMKLVRDIMLCKPGENLVITYDTCVDERVVHALTEAADTIESVTTGIYYPTAGGFNAAPPKPEADAIAAADVWIELTYASILRHQGNGERLSGNADRADQLVPHRRVDRRNAGI